MGQISREIYAPPGALLSGNQQDVVIKKKEGQPWGVLEIDNPKRHVYDEHDINFVTGFANVLAEAVNTSKRNSVVQAALEQMKDMVADRDRLLAAQDRLLTEKG